MIVWMREPGGTWLCPTAFDRTRLLDMEARLTKARVLMYAALGAGFVACAPIMGWWIIAPLVFTVAAYQVLQPLISRVERPEYVVAVTVVIAQIMIGMGVALTGGPTSPVLPLLGLPIVTLPARFGTRGVQAGVVVTILVIVVTTLGVEYQATLDNPEYVVMAISALFGLAAFSDGLMRAEVESRSHSGQDSLTGLLNRKALVPQFDEVARQAGMTGRAVCLVLMDLDHFKEVNDVHGHARGDAVLKDVAELMRGHLRSFELVYRVGGEEFLILMPGVDRTGGRIVAERLRSAFAHARPGGLEVTASFGVAMATGAAVAFDPLFDAADKALYRAKDEGRDRVVLAPELRPEPGAATVGAVLRSSAAMSEA
jgi:diguanylate cyclase (GGDEF)-like protein